MSIGHIQWLIAHFGYCLQSKASWRRQVGENVFSKVFSKYYLRLGIFKSFRKGSHFVQVDVILSEWFWKTRIRLKIRSLEKCILQCFLETTSSWNVKFLKERSPFQSLGTFSVTTESLSSSKSFRRQQQWKLFLCRNLSKRFEKFLVLISNISAFSRTCCLGCVDIVESLETRLTSLLCYTVSVLFSNNLPLKNLQQRRSLLKVPCAKFG